MRCVVKFGLCVVREMIKTVWHRRLKRPLKSFVLNMTWLFGGLILGSAVAIGVGKLWSLLLGDFYWSFSVWFLELSMNPMMMQYWILGMIILITLWLFAQVFMLIIASKREIVRSMSSVVKKCKERENTRATE